jgi:hypothetical protein
MMLPAESESNCQLFAYTPLPDTDTTVQWEPPHIRLIEVHDCDPDDPTIRVSIYVTSVEDAPSYEAVSYTWGDESIQEQIHVKHASSLSRSALASSADCDGLMTVRKNCADVLRQVRHFRTSKYYWIDAISIDQQNVQEKNVQVARMGATFKQADGVLACIGMHDQSSQLIVSMFENFHSHLARANLSIAVLAEKKPSGQYSGNRLGQKCRHDETSTEDPFETCKKSCHEWVQGIDRKTSLDFALAMESLAKRPYFWRIWTLQEVWVTHRIQIFCGFDKLPLSTLLFWWEDWANFGRDLLPLSEKDLPRLGRFEYHRYAIGIMPSGLGLDYELILHQRQSGLWEGSASTIRQLSLHQLLALCGGRKCQDLRDIVYGTLTIANWSSMEVKMPDGSWYTDEDEAAPILPDYNQSAFELAKRLMPRFDALDTMERMCKALQFQPETDEIRRGMALRSGPCGQQPSLASLDEWHWTKNLQNLARVELQGFQFGSDSQYQLRTSSNDPATFTRIIKHYEDESKCVAIACGRVRDGDWLVRTHGDEALILREYGSFLFIIGKALFGDHLWPDFESDTDKWPLHETVTVWFGVDDLVVLLCGAEMPFRDVVLTEDDELGVNKESILAFLNSRVCREWGSSFGMLPSEDGVETDNESGKPSSRLNSYRLRSVHSSWKRGPDDAASSDTEEASKKFKDLIL